jgi:hypothetical protein
VPDPTSERRIECVTCATVIELSFVVPEHKQAYEIQVIDELLVDYGWLPTTTGSYCPRHARR